VPDVWVVNASPLIAFDRIGCVHVLGQLAREVVLPAAVIAEVAAGPHPLAAAQLGRHRSVVVGGIHPVVAAWDLGRARQRSYRGPPPKSAVLPSSTIGPRVDAQLRSASPRLEPFASCWMPRRPASSRRSLP